MSEGTHSYYDWQVSTLLLAYDVADPISRDDTAKLSAREQAVEKELHAMAKVVVPDEYHRDQSRELPTEVVISMTRATITRAVEIMGQGTK